ncbi:hypothetical protein GW17_00006180 [Ensete ventricosum]|nr:hypothetical protein GW17_00006180 [Ensete ventricosum]
MLPLRVPNSGIRAMAARRGGQPRPGHSQGLQGVGCDQGQPAREASGARKGRRLWAEALPAGTISCDQPAGVAAARGHNRMQRGARKGLPPAGAAVPVAGVAAP